MRKSTAGVAGLITVLLLTGAKGCAGFGGSGSTGDLNFDTAIGACEKSVEKQLKAPSTADFSNEHASYTGGGKDAIRVRGDVDAENSFGAKLRDSWTGYATTSDGGDSWYCLATLQNGF